MGIFSRHLQVFGAWVQVFAVRARACIHMWVRMRADAHRCCACAYDMCACECARVLVSLERVRASMRFVRERACGSELVSERMHALQPVQHCLRCHGHWHTHRIPIMLNLESSRKLRYD